MQAVGPLSSGEKICGDVEQRAAKTLQWAVQNKLSLLTNALDHLTLGRAKLYRTILERLDASGVLAESAVEGPKSEIEQAVAVRGPMPLFQADVQLHRARLFKDKEALVEARRLIEKHGYGRRLEELADAEAAPEGCETRRHLQRVSPGQVSDSRP